MTNNGTLKLVIYVACSAIAIIAALKAWILLPQQVAIQAAQNTKEHIEYKENIEELDDEGHALFIDVVTIKGDIRHIITAQERQEKRQAEQEQRQIVRDKGILDEIKALHK